MSDLISLDQARREAAMKSGGKKMIPVVDPIALQGVEVPPRRWLVPGLIPMGQVTLLGGDGGLGKSLLCLQLQVAAASGKSWLGLETRPVKSYGLYAEDDTDELHRRLDAIARHYGTELGDLENMMCLAAAGFDAVLTKHTEDGGIRTLPLYINILSRSETSFAIPLEPRASMMIGAVAFH